ncbi:MAG TPA: SRPBCC domain-containing protein [Myxococcaceae bacterium]|nr:SRPBCC domain-containing protein [Myxococcaceae bacterium]
MPTPIEIRNEVYVAALPEAVWRAIVDPEMTRAWVYGTRLRSTLAPGAPYAYLAEKDVIAVSGTVLACEAQRRLVLSWKAHWDPSVEADPPSRVTWELEASGPRTTRLRVIHDQFQDLTPTYVGSVDAWPFMLSSLKSLLETGRALEAASA